ncbi:MAG: hypothetical protein PHD70_10070 [Anaerostipes sp.]|nr:hypothetical protein [Anaerostipes sp.]MDD3746802.1 hypothetical protein [Anaerostipes sp.]
MNKKKLVLVVCGAGTLTSVMASQGVEEGLKNNGVKDVEVKVGRIDDIERFVDRISVLVCTMNIRTKYDFPVIRGTAFVTGDEEAQEDIINQIVTYLKEND